jgi:dUTP pyrophosphatase
MFRREPKIKVYGGRGRSRVPYKAYSEDAGFDLRSAELEKISISPTSYCFVKTGLHFIMPEGIVGFVKPKSGLAKRWGIDVLAGVIDSGYTGEVEVGLINHGKEVFEIEPYDKIAQIVFLKLADVDPILKVIGCICFEKEAHEKDRQNRGFGSTGNK